MKTLSVAEIMHTNLESHKAIGGKWVDLSVCETLVETCEALSSVSRYATSITDVTGTQYPLVEYEIDRSYVGLLHPRYVCDQPGDDLYLSVLRNSTEAKACDPETFRKHWNRLARQFRRVAEFVSVVPYIAETSTVEFLKSGRPFTDEPEGVDDELCVDLTMNPREIKGTPVKVKSDWLALTFDDDLVQRRKASVLIDSYFNRTEGN